jgi:hypothetical protein
MKEEGLLLDYEVKTVSPSIPRPESRTQEEMRAIPHKTLQLSPIFPIATNDPSHNGLKDSFHKFPLQLGRFRS